MEGNRVGYEKGLDMRCLIVILALASAGGVIAADRNGRFAPKGAGLISCETFVAEHAAGSDAYLLFRGWIDGYLTAANRYEAEAFDMLAAQTPSTIAAAIDNHCSKNPQDRVLDVMLSIVDRLRGQRIRSEAQRVKIENSSGDYVLVYGELVTAIRAALGELGYSLNPDTKAFDDRTSAALREFQSARNLKVTGLPDQATLWQLLGPLGMR